MKRLLLAALVIAHGPLYAEQPAAVPPTDANKALLQQAFDGAMTCSAITAINADNAGPEQRWRWENRSFAFGMLAARFWNDATGQPMTAEVLDAALNDYAGKIVAMTPDALAPYDTSCAGKYADMDKLCESNPCLHSGPPPADPG